MKFAPKRSAPKWATTKRATTKWAAQKWLSHKVVYPLNLDPFCLKFEGFIVWEPDDV